MIFHKWVIHWSKFPVYMVNSCEDTKYFTQSGWSLPVPHEVLAHSDNLLLNFTFMFWQGEGAKVGAHMKPGELNYA